MRKLMVIPLMLAASAAGDTVTLRNGRSVDGTYIGGDARSIRVAVGERVETFDRNDVVGLELGQQRSLKRVRTNVRDTNAPNGEIPAGTGIVVRLTDAADSRQDRAGKEYAATLDEAVVVNGATLLERGCDVTLKLVEDKRSGRLRGRSEMVFEVVEIRAGERRLRPVTTEVTQRSGSRTASTAKKAAGLAAIGAAVGAIAGGGQGAAIGAASGAGLGAATQVATGGAHVRIPAETRLTFALREPLRM